MWGGKALATVFYFCTPVPGLLPLLFRLHRCMGIVAADLRYEKNPPVESDCRDLKWKHMRKSYGCYFALFEANQDLENYGHGIIRKKGYMAYKVRPLEVKSKL